MEQSEAQAEAVGRRLAERIERFSGEQYGLPPTCRLPRCRRTGRCCGTALACRAELDAAVAAKRAASPLGDTWDGLALVRQALLIALAQKEAEAAAGPNDRAEIATSQRARAATAPHTRFQDEALSAQHVRSPRLPVNMTMSPSCCGKGRLALGILAEENTGREKVFLHKKYLALLAGDEHEFEPYQAFAGTQPAS